jgi:phosphohistidine phosphatase SixA
MGGTAATLAMEEAGLEFRATKDLDIVLHIGHWPQLAAQAAGFAGGKSNL